MAIRMLSDVKLPKVGSDEKAEAFIAGAAKGAAPSSGPSKVVVNMRFDADLLARIDEAARRHGVSRTAWLHIIATRSLDRGEG
jgi:hypothetical protein